MTSGDLAGKRMGSAVPGLAHGGAEAAQAAPPKPLGEFPADVEHEVPEGAHYKVTTSSVVAYFAGHHDAFRWAQTTPGKIRTVR